MYADLSHSPKKSKNGAIANKTARKKVKTGWLLSWYDSWTAHSFMGINFRSSQTSLPLLLLSCIRRLSVRWHRYALRAESPSIFLDQSGCGRRLCEHRRHFVLSMRATHSKKWMSHSSFDLSNLFVFFFICAHDQSPRVFNIFFKFTTAWELTDLGRSKETLLAG